jgi:hypothetical protein
MFATSASEVAQMVLSVAPLIGVYIVGAVFAATHRRQSPRAAALVFAAVGLMTFSLFLQYSLVWMANYFLQDGWSHGEMIWAFAAMGAFTSILSAAGIFLLILAAFTGRRRED